MPYYYYGFDWTYIFIIIGAVISMAASAKVQSTYRKYARVDSMSGMTGAMAVQEILRRNNIFDVTVAQTSGYLSDHYDPRTKQIRLSDATYGSCSVAAIGVAAHECGHVLQHHTGYVPLSIRTALVPVANIGTSAGLWIVMLGIIFGLADILITIGIVLFSMGVLFQLVTLPVEFNASSRALKMLNDYNILRGEELKKSRSVLFAAALTYVAAALASILSLLRLILLANRRNGRR